MTYVSTVISGNVLTIEYNLYFNIQNIKSRKDTSK